MAEEKKGFAGLLQDPNFITGMSVLAANADPRRHWSEGYADASRQLSAMERSALARAELEMRKQRFEQEQQQMEAERQRAAEYQKVVSGFGPETPLSEQIRMTLPFATPGQALGGMQTIAGMQKPADFDLKQQAFQDWRAQNPDKPAIEFEREWQSTALAGKVSPRFKPSVLPGGGRGLVDPVTGQYARDEFGNIIQATGSAQEEIAGLEAKRRYNWPETERAFKSRMGAFDQSLDAVANVRSTLDRAGILPVTGAGGALLSNIGGTVARDLRANIDTVKARIGFDELQKMRDNSPTGGALGQVTERELQLLQSVIANLEQSQSQPQFEENLRRVEAQIAASKAAINQAYQEDLRRFGPGQMPAQPGGVQGDSSSIDDLVNKYVGQ